MISQFYILSPRGDTIISRDFRGDIVKGTAEIFFRRVKAWSEGGEAPPILPQDGVVYIHLKRSGLYFVFTTQQNVSPAFCLELLQQMTKLFKDFCGVLNEESIRRNFVLIYEILDEVIDAGYPQHTSTERLKQCIHNEAVLVESALFPAGRRTFGAAVTGGVGSGAGLAGFGLPGGFGSAAASKTVPSNASHRPVHHVTGSGFPTSTAGALGKGPMTLESVAARGVMALTRGALTRQGFGGGMGGVKDFRNEIFVDILERLTVALNAQGAVLNCQVDGCIQMKSYLFGGPALRLALNEDIVIREEGREAGVGSKVGIGGSGGGAAADVPYIDDCNFSECVDTSEFEGSRVLTIRPPDGEFVVMNYRITEAFRVPFRIKSHIHQISATKLELTIELYADIPPHHYGGNVVVVCPMPKSARSVTTESLALSQVVDFLQQESKVVWNIKKFQGGTSQCMRARITLQEPIDESLQRQSLTRLKKEVGPISMTFEIPMYNVSSLQIRYLRVVGSTFGGGAGNSVAPFRWVRYVTQSSSYVGRL